MNEGLDTSIDVVGEIGEFAQYDLRKMVTTHQSCVSCRLPAREIQFSHTDNAAHIITEVGLTDHQVPLGGNGDPRAAADAKCIDLKITRWDYGIV